MNARFSIDSAQVRDALIMGWGWYLADDAGVVKIEVEVYFADGTAQVIACLASRARDDVVQAFPTNQYAATAGFIFLSQLSSRTAVTGATLLVSLDNGDFQRYPIEGFPARFAPDSLAPDVLLYRLKKAWRLVRAGRLLDLAKRLRFVVSRIARNSFARVVGSLVPTAKVDLIFDHQLGGGANKYRDEKIAQIIGGGGTTVLVTFDLPRLQYRLQMRTSQRSNEEVFENVAALRHRLERLRYAVIHVNDFVSFPNPLAMLGLVERLAGSSEAELILYLHDFLPVCPSYTLINAEGTYCGIPSAETCRNCLKTNTSVFPTFVTTKEILPWRDAWAVSLQRATKIVAFSDSTVEIFQRAFPSLDWRTKVLMRPHVISTSLFPRVTPQIGTPLKIAVIGNIGFVKGAEMVHDLLALIDQGNLPIRVVVIGTLERASTSPALTVTGTFKSSALPKLLQAHGIGVCWLPSICPETFSYVTQEIITMHMPLVCFDLGAPAGRVRTYQFGAIATQISAQGALSAITSLAHTVSIQYMNGENIMPQQERKSRSVVFTCAAINYLPKVRKLFSSIREHHPEFELVLALADELPPDLNLSESTIDRVLLPSELCIENEKQWTFFHDVVELSTAIKPFALKKLLRESDVERVIYFDPDMVLFSRIDDILEILTNQNIALTPHQVEPDSTLEAIKDNEIASLKHGVFNLGFIAVRNTAETVRFANWWAERLYHFCVADIPNGLFTDQKWMNFAPIFFDGVHILKSPRFNVATWNLTKRKVKGSRESGFTVNGVPLGFYHFTGFDSGAHRIMAVKNGADSPAVFDLIRWYEEQTENDDKDPLSALPWGYANFNDGSKISKAARVLYRSRIDLKRAFPDPFSTKGNNNYKNWLIQEYGSQETTGRVEMEASALAAKRSTWRRTTDAVSRYSREPGYRTEIQKRASSILKYEGLGSLLRYLLNRR